MSRSYRKPYVKEGFNGHSKRKRFFKNLANRTLRRTKEDIPNGKVYRKFFDSWLITDYNFYVDLEKEKFPWQYSSK